MSDMPSTWAAADGAVRVADAVLRSTGGRTIFLRLPAPAVANDDSEQLGLATPQAEDVSLAPVSLRKANSATVLLVSASAVQALVTTRDFQSDKVLFQTALGIVMDGALYEIETINISQTGAVPYCYCLTLKAPVQ